MKKFFRLVSVLAIAGATFAYSGCTDYSDDIDKVADRVESAEGEIATLKQQVANLQTLVADYETVKANAAKVPGLETKVAGLETEISNIKATIATLATKEWVEGTFATKDALASALTKIGELESALSTLQTKHNEDVTALENKIAAVKTTAESALGEVASLKEALGVYASAAAIQAALDEKLDIADFDAKFNAALEKALGEYGVITVAIENEINAAVAAISKYFKVTNLTIVPDLYIEGIPAIVFENITYTCMDKEEPQGYYWAAKPSSVSYRVAPKAADLTDVVWGFVGDKAENVMTRGIKADYATAPNAPIAVVGAPAYDAATGYATFSVKKVKDLRHSEELLGEFDIVALEATVEDAKVYSEYARVMEVNYDASDLYISDKAKLAAKAECHYPLYQFRAEDLTQPGVDVGYYTMDYDKEFNLKALVATCFEKERDVHTALNIEDYEFYYEFEIVGEYDEESDETVTDQQHVLKMKEGTTVKDGVYVTATKNGVYPNKETIGRMPIVRVKLMHEGHVVRDAYVKVLITVEHADDINITTVASYTTEICYGGTHDYEVSEQRMWEEIYQKFNMSHVEFWNNYEFAASSVTINNRAVADSFPKPELIDGLDNQGNATKKVTWSFTEAQVGEIVGANSIIVGKLTLVNKIATYSDLPMYINFIFTVDAKAPDYAGLITSKINGDYARIPEYWNDEVFMGQLNIPSSSVAPASECIFNSPYEKAYWAEVPYAKAGTVLAAYDCIGGVYSKISAVNVYGVEGLTTLTYGTTSDKDVYTSTYTDADGSQKSIALNKTSANVKKALNEGTIVATIQYYIVDMFGKEINLDLSFNVHFIKPLYLNLYDRQNVYDAVTGGSSTADFNYMGLFTDWRGFAVYPASAEFKTEPAYAWVQTTFPEYQIIPEVKAWKPAWYEFEFANKEVTVESNTAGYEYKVTLTMAPSMYATYQQYIAGTLLDNAWSEVIAQYVFATATKTSKEFVGVGLTPEAAEADAIQQIYNDADWGKEIYGHCVDANYICGCTASEPVVTEAVIPANTTITLWSIVNVITHEPVEVVVQEADVIQTNVINPEPVAGVEYDPATITPGTTIGAWTWTRLPDVTTSEPVVEQNLWDFYGVQGAVLHVDQAYTNLTGGKLPTTVTLVDNGNNTVTFNNTGTPLGTEYNIYIPVTAEYGWGVVKSTLVINVLPIQNN